MHFYQGLPISLYYFSEDGSPKSDVDDISDPIDVKQKKTGSLKLKKVTLGPGGPEKSQMFHATITKNTWFSRILDRNESVSGRNINVQEGMPKLVTNFNNNHKCNIIIPLTSIFITHIHYCFIEDFLDTSSYSLVGVSIAPGFDYNDLRTAPYGCLMEI